MRQGRSGKRLQLSDQDTELLFGCEVAVATEVSALAPVYPQYGTYCMATCWHLKF